MMSDYLTMRCPICNAQNPEAATSCSACATPLKTAGGSGERLAIGTVLQQGAYVVDRVLGQGGFGITYLGSDTRLGRAVAVKEFFPAGCYRERASIQPSGAMAPADFDSARQRFLDEARTIARFRHPGIVDVFAAFEENNTAYMVMEYLVGKTLGALVLEQGPLQEADALRYICEAGEALERVHESGLLHRDIKPDNLMRCHDGRIVLIDFGTARDFSMGRTQGHTVVVTPGYAPLEQYAQRAQRGVFSDVYGLAATLFYLLTGEAPIPATDRAAGVEFVPPHHLVQAVSRSLGETVQWAMELKVEKRPQSVRTFLRALTEPDQKWHGATAPEAAPRLYATPSHEPAHSAIEAWRYSKQSVKALHQADTSMTEMVEQMRVQQESSRRSRRAVTHAVSMPAAAATAREESVASVCVLSTENNSFAKELKWPNRCPCCGRTPNTTVPLTCKPADPALKGTRIWNVPYCATCVRHIRWGDRPKHSLNAMLTALCLTFVPAWALSMVSPAGFIHLTIWAIFGGSSAAAWILFYSIMRLECCFATTTRTCTTDTMAVACTDARTLPEGGTTYTFEFKDPCYRQAFERLNRDPLLATSLLPGTAS